MTTSPVFSFLAGFLGVFSPRVNVFTWIKICHFACFCAMLEDLKCFELLLILKGHTLSIFRKLKQPMPFCSITPPDTYVIIKGCNWNGWWHSSVLWKNHPRSFHEAFLSMLTFLPWHIVKIILICENSCTINWFHKTFYLRYLTWFWICFRFCFTCSHFNPLTTWMQLVTYFNKVCSLKKHETVFWKRQNVFLCST